ncbi:PKD domain-containing protein [Desulfurococcus mucosus]|uniref:PKD domain-containing protein n=1 Tax=Desulfurococcus mucosus (strain ATCC 35584 / DSM 2162 / JCM 9187 / O7/1) TaxID=765177 RepID=E8R8F5_DESM0|nr:PKD domain-containing protein [Desulfurococcus mucosus]ADV64781.1 hypothetical protein Desmu_0468 [Desulfurococcus mucosus DSM 2162]
MDASLLLGYVDWVLWASSTAVIVLSVVRHASGSRDAGRWFLAGLTGLLIAGFADAVVNALYGGDTGILGSLPYGWVFPAASLGLTLTGGLYIVSGRLEEGVWQVLGGLLVVGLGLMALYLAGGRVGGLDRVLYVYVWSSRQGYFTGEAVNISVAVSPPVDTVEYVVSWGDGVVEHYTGGAAVNLSHVYASSGAYTVVINASGGGLTGFNSLALSISDKPWTPPWPFDIVVSPVAGFFNSLWQALTTPFNLQLLTTSPRLEEGSPEWGLYTAVLDASLTGLGFFLALRLIQAAVNGDARGFIDSVKEALVAVLLSLTAPYIYNASVDILNALSMRIVQGVDPMPSIASALTLISTGVILGFFIPAAAHLAALLTLILAATAALVAVRHWLTLSIAASTPLLAVAYLHPGLRGAVNRVIGLWSGLVLAGPLSAVFMKTWSLQVGGLGQAVTGLLVYAMLPNIMGLLGGGVGGAAERIGLFFYTTALKITGASKTRSQGGMVQPRPQDTGEGRVRLHTGRGVEGYGRLRVQGN